MANLHRAIQGVTLALAEIASLSFNVSEGASSAALASDALFEGQLIREAEDTEAGLFRPTRDRGDLAVGDYEAIAFSDESDWQIGRRHAPLRNPAPVMAPSSLAPDDAAIARGHLLAAERLSETFPLPRFSERIATLQHQLASVEESIKVLQDDKGNGVGTKTGVIDVRHVQNERLEVLALTDVRDERTAAVRRLNAQINSLRKKAKAAIERKTPSLVDASPITLDHITPTTQEVQPSPVVTSNDVAAPIPALTEPLTALENLPPPERQSSHAAPPSQSDLSPKELSAPCREALRRLHKLCLEHDGIASAIRASSGLQSEAVPVMKTLEALLVPSVDDLLPHQQMETAIALELFKSLLFASAATDEASISTPSPDAPLPYIIRPSTVFTVDAPSEEVLLPFDPLRSRLAAFARKRGWEEGLGQKAIYALVAKRAIRIDRRGKPLLYIC